MTNEPTQLFFFGSAALKLFETPLVGVEENELVEHKLHECLFIFGLEPLYLQLVEAVEALHVHRRVELLALAVDHREEASQLFVSLRCDPSQDNFPKRCSIVRLLASRATFGLELVFLECGQRFMRVVFVLMGVVE